MNKKLITALSLSAMTLPLFAGSTVHAVTGSGKESTATLKVTKSDDEAALILVAVPSFLYEDVPATTVLNGGTVNTNGSPNLQINDQRATETGWSLSVKGTDLRGTNETITNAILKVSESTSFSDINIGLGGTEGTTTGTKSINSAVSGDLTFVSNQSLKLDVNDAYVSNLTWTLSAGTSRAPEL